MVPPKPQLAQREENEAKAAREVRKKQVRKKQVQKTTVPTQTPKPQRIQNRFQLKAELDEKETDATTGQPKKKTGATAKRELEKQQKAAEFRALESMPIPAPLPYTLQLPDLPPRQNHTGRDLKLKLITPDPTFPLSPAAREKHVATLMDSIRDCRIAQDKVTFTTSYWHVWLKQVHAGTYTYKEIDMERVCRKLVNIAEALHEHGLGATDIYCPEAIKKVMAAQPMEFADRIEKLGNLMRKTKARCNDFMLGNTLEDTIALIDLKVSDQKSNSANNYLRSLKVEETNRFFKVPKGTKWPKDENGKPLPHSELQARGFGTPADMVSGDVNNEQDALDEGGDWQPAGSVQQLPFSDPAFAHYQGVSHDQKPALDWLTEMDMSQLGVASPFDMTNVQSPHTFSPTAFDGLQEHVLEVESAHGNFWQPPAEPQLFASTHPAHMESPFSSFRGSSMSSAHDGFDNSSFGYGQQMSQQIDMLPFHQNGGALAFAGFGENTEKTQTWPVHDERPEVHQAFVPGRAEHELRDVSRLREPMSHTFAPKPVTRAAKHKLARGIGAEQGEGIVQPANERARHAKPDAGPSNDSQGMFMNSLLRENFAQSSVKRAGGRRKVGFSKSRAPAREVPMSGQIADAQKDVGTFAVDRQEGEVDAELAAKELRAQMPNIEELQTQSSIDSDILIA